jgi:hypothetical protein
MMSASGLINHCSRKKGGRKIFPRAAIDRWQALRLEGSPS